MSCLSLSVDYVRHNECSHPQKRLCRKLGGLPGSNAKQWQWLTSTITTGPSSREDCVWLLPVVTGPRVSPVFAHMGEKAATTIPILLRGEMKAQAGKGSHQVITSQGP